MRKLAFGLLGVLLAATILMVVSKPRDPAHLPRGLKSVLIAIETAQSEEEARTILSQPDLDLASLRGNFQADFLFLGGYGGWFAFLGTLIAARFRWLGVAAVAAAVAAAGCDIGENLRALEVLDGGGDVDAMRAFSLWKWGLVGVAAALQPLAFVPLRGGVAVFRCLSWAIAGLSLASGILALWGVADHAKLELSMLPLLVAVPLEAVLFGLFWNEYRARLLPPPAASAAPLARGATRC